MVKKMTNLYTLATTTVFLLFFAVEASAYEPLSPLPTVGGADGSGTGGYLSNLFLIVIGLAGVLAVLMIVIGGIQYIGSGMSPSGKEDAKGKITSAILGLLLALGSYLILNTINPELVRIRI